MSKVKEPKERQGIQEEYLLAVPSNEYNTLDFKVEFFKEEDKTRWLHMIAIVNGKEVLAWAGWARDSKDKRY